ncbi:hypothetical protein AO269_28470 [Pseudomonas putida]|nr:hypothetical protein AO269_28470 [Pseudomonas putida]
MLMMRMRVRLPEDQDRLVQQRSLETGGNPAMRIAYHSVTHNVYYVKLCMMPDVLIEELLSNLYPPF